MIERARRVVLLAGVLVLWSAGGAMAGPAPGSCDGQPAKTHIHRAIAILDHAYRHVQWDMAEIATRSEKRRWREHRDCLTEPADRERVSDHHDAAEASRDAWRKRKELAFRRRHAPYNCGRHGYFAIPCSIVQCESQFDFEARNRYSTAGGAYQILESTWYRHGGKEYSGSYPAAKATEREQHVIGRRVWKREGRGAWEC